MTNLNIISKRICIALGAAVFIILLGWTGHQDYVEQICYNMPEDTYEAISLKLGDRASNSAIAEEYMKNKKFWDQYNH
uniref:hypothetical protein n=1 Tax=Bacteroides cellulosilyticus TaxID=246787 RepID=UPI003FEF5125